MKLQRIATLFLLGLVLSTTSICAQSLGDLFNKDNINKVVNAVTGGNTNVQLVGKWNYSGSAVEFESDNILMKAGGIAAAATVESKVNEQLSKVGIKPGQVSFTFEADSTFTTTVGSKPMKGTYSYDATNKQLNLSFAKLLNVNAKVTYNNNQMDLLFNSDKLLKVIALISKQAKSSSLNAIGSLTEKYDGMMIGFKMDKQ